MKNVYCKIIIFFFTFLHYIHLHVLLILYIPYNLIIILATTDIIPVCDIINIKSGLMYRKIDRKQTTTYSKGTCEHIVKKKLKNISTFKY